MFGIESIVDEIKSKCSKFLSNKEEFENLGSRPIAGVVGYLIN